ncbi:MAG: hypothetical protein KDA65_02105 [Planctomycetaceae bacterium]|nr:hypothetical protein [Planctomycetaceae bacterium]
MRLLLLSGLALSLLAQTTFSRQATAAEPLFVGAATIDITPPEGYRMSGYFYERLNEGTKDPLQAKALYFGQGETEAILIACDLIGMELQVTQTARRRISEQTGIPVQHIAISATHSHTGPLYFGALRNRFHEVAVQEKGEDTAEKVDYPAFLVKQLVDVSWKAVENRENSTLRAGYGHEDRVNFNRR